MKKTMLHALPRPMILLIAILLICIHLILPISAEEPQWEIVDDAELLTAEQLSALSAQARELTAQYQTDFVIVTVDSLGGKTAKAYANDFFDDNHCGFGPNRDGILLLLAMDSRDYYFLTNGSPTEKLAQAGGLPTLENKVVPHLSDGNYYLAFGTFLDLSASIIAKPTSAPGASNPSYNDDFVYIGFDEDPASERGETILIFAVIGIIAGFVTTLIMKHGMKTARAKHVAADYVRPGSFRLTRQQDLYLYRTRTRVRIQSNNTSGGGRSGGSGGSRGGGGGKF